MRKDIVPVTWSAFGGPFGDCHLASTGKGLCALSVRGPVNRFLEQFAKRPGVQLREVKDCMPEARRQILDYFRGERREFDLPLDLFLGTAFQQQVWQALRRIPYGETRSYRWLAEQTGRPNAFRAVGQANGRNPMPLVVPCHRVICADGSIGGFSAGLDIKRKLLALEGVKGTSEKWTVKSGRGPGIR
jgi:methylated-DNA-[protein]-cysteine S-methyltransferase